MVLTACCTREVVGLIVIRGDGCCEALLLNCLDGRTNGLIIDGIIDVEEGMIG